MTVPMRARPLIRRPDAAVALRLVRALACTLPLAWLLGGGCVWAFSTNNHTNDNNNGGTTVVVTGDGSGGMTSNDTAGDTTIVAGAGIVGTELAGLDHQLFELGEICFDGATRAVACPDAAPWAVSPARIWPPERIGEPELAAFAEAVLRVNEGRLGLPLPAAQLQYLDTTVAEGAATVRFADREAGGAPAVAVEYAATGEVVAVTRRDGDKTSDLR